MQRKKPLNDRDLAEFESAQDFEALLLQSARQMAAGDTRTVYTPAVEARQKLQMTQARFAQMLEVSARTIQQWEQGRRTPSGAARALIEIARVAPEAFAAAGLTHKTSARREKGKPKGPTTMRS